jgi:hypothetical protein
MPLIFDKAHNLHRLHSFQNEAEFEKQVVALADQIFGPSTIYVDVKKKIKGGDIVSIPDGYVLDMAEPDAPRLYVVENEIVSHDPFQHIGIQMMKFVVGFESAQLRIKQFLMAEIMKTPGHLKRLEVGCRASGARNIDAYLERAVYGKFHGLVVIDEAQPDLFHVLKKINAEIDVLQMRAFRTGNGDFLYEFDTLYDEDEEPDPVEPKGGKSGLSPDETAAARASMLARRAVSDTVIVPAREDGFITEFLGNHQWFAIRLSPAMKDRLKYIAAYQVAPVSAVTHIAEIQEIRPYQDTGKYQVIFKGPARTIGPITSGELKYSFQGPTYVQSEKLFAAKTLEDVLTFWRKT